MPDNDYLKATTETIFEHCPRFRILVVGKCGVGKSSLINRTFNVNLAAVSHLTPGESDLEMEIFSASNPRFVLHDSQGYEYGDVDKLYALEQFIAERCSKPKLADRLHAVWLCIETPIASGRELEAGDERLLEVCKERSVPVVIVYTKYDLFVAANEFAILESLDNVSDMDESAVDVALQQAAKISFDDMCIMEFKKKYQERTPPYTHVSDRNEYISTLSDLVQITQDSIVETMKNMTDAAVDVADTDGTSTIQACPSIVFASAQRVLPSIKIQATIDVGRAKYWRGLASSLHFPGKTLKACVRALHTDIVTLWNFCDTEEILPSESFQARISLLISELVDEAPGNPNKHAAAGFSALGPIGGAVGVVAASSVHIVVPIIAAVVFAYWVYEVYSQTPNIVCCLMAYIVDLTNVMRSLFYLTQDAELSQPLSHEVCDLAIAAYERSRVKRDVHREIRLFMRDKSIFHIVQRDKIFEKVVNLIEEHPFRPEEQDVEAAREVQRRSV